jgi:hypothetical protein
MAAELRPRAMLPQLVSRTDAVRQKLAVVSFSGLFTAIDAEPTHPPHAV